MRANRTAWTHRVVCLSAALALAATGSVVAVGAPEGMVPIPPGRFLMGDSFAEGNANELPAHSVDVSGFYIDAYEVSKAIWDQVAAWALVNGYDLQPGDGQGKGGDHPVQGISWYEAAKWANARSELEGLTPCYYADSRLTTVYRAGHENVQDAWVKWDADGYRLPTSAEWEKAARGGCDGRRFSWCGPDAIDHTRANYYSTTWFEYDTGGEEPFDPRFAVGAEPFTSPVGSFPANRHGLYDMTGNVYEWCWDWRLPSPRDTYYSTSPVKDPHGPSEELGANRVIRGGSWFSAAGPCRTAAYGDRGPDFESNYLGFRLVRAAPGLAASTADQDRSGAWPADRELLYLTYTSLQKVLGDPTTGFPEVMPILTGFERAMNMAVGPDGLIYISDRDARKIVRCDSNGKNVTTILKSTAIAPYDMSFDAQGNLYFTTFSDDLSCTASEGVWMIPGARPGVKPVRVIGGGNMQDCKTVAGTNYYLSAIRVITAGPHAGDILIGGLGDVAIARAVAPDFTTLVPYVRGRSGVANPSGTASVVISTAFTDFVTSGTQGHVLATDWFRDQILEFGPDGEFLRVFADLRYANLLTTDRDGNIYVSSAVMGGMDFQQLVVFSPEGERLFQIPLNNVRAIVVVEP